MNDSDGDVERHEVEGGWSARLSKMFVAPEDMPRPSFSADEYSQVVSCAMLDDVMLLDVDFKLKPSYFDIELAEAHRSLAGDLLDARVDPETGIASAVLHWEAMVGDAPDIAPHLRLTANYLVRYRGLRDARKDAALAFLEKVGRLACYPYFRALASQLSWSSNAHFPILPILSDR